MALLFRRSALLAAIPDQAVAPSFQALGVTTAAGTARWTRGAGLTGSADGTAFFFSFWINLNDPGSGQVYATTAGEVVLAISATPKVFITAENAVGSPIQICVNFTSTTATVTRNAWEHWSGSFDVTNAANRWMRKNGVTETITVSTFINEQLNFAVGNHGIGANPGGGSPLEASLAEIWIDHQWIPNTDANVFKFISGAGGFPVDLGSDGTTPGFGQPIMYFSRRNGVADFATNKGDGGGFTVTGTPGDGGSLPTGGGGGGGGSPLSWDDSAITTRAPKLYLPLEDPSGNPVDNSASNLTATMNGTPTAYQVSTEKGLGINLGGAADILVNHSTVFETDHGIARNSASVTWVYSEVCMSGQFKVNSFEPTGSPSEDAYLFGKSGDPAAWANSLNVWVLTDGRLRIDARMPWRQVRMESLPAAIAVGVEFHVCVFLGREGLWATLNGRMLNNGEKDPRHWYGWDHRVRGLRNNAAPAGSAQGGFNAGAIRIGKSSTGARANIVVSKFAVFVTGTFANRLGLTDAQAISGGSGTALGHPLFDNSTQNVSTAQNIQTAIDARAAAGGGTVVLAAGTHTRATNLLMASNVRLKGAGIGVTILNMTSGASIGTGDHITGVPSLTSFTFPGNLTAGQTSFNLTNSLGNDGILLLVSTGLLMREYIPTAPLPAQGNEVNRAEFMPILNNTGSVVTLEGGLYFPYPTSDQLDLLGFVPQVKDVEITDMTINGDLRTGTNQSIVQFHGARRVFLRRIHSIEDVAYSGKPTPDRATCCIRSIGCVDFVVEDCEWITTSTFGTYAQEGGSHPYASQHMGGCNNVIMRGYGHSNDWVILDQGADNFGGTWAGAGAATWYVPGKRCEAIDVQGTVRWFHAAFGSHPCVHSRWIGCETMNGGGFSGSGFQHEHFDCRSHFPTVAGFPAPANSSKPPPGHYGFSNRGGHYACRVTLEGQPGHWFNVDFDRDSVYVLITKPNTNAPSQGPTANNANDAVNCQYVSCTAPLPTVD